jgi:hypothetical protein
MLKDLLQGKSAASYVEYGYGQVEPNHLSAQRTAQVYAQLPAAANITKLEQGQFVKYDYAHGVVNFTGAGEWMLVYNEIKLYREHQMDCEFAMLKDNYQARVYSPFGTGLDKNGDPTANGDIAFDRQSRYLNGKDAEGNTEITVGDKTYKYDDVTAGPDMYELHYNEDPFHIAGPYKEAMMPAGTTMVPRVLKTNVGDIFTTNTLNATVEEAAVGKCFAPGADGILAPVADDAAGMKWQVVKVYTMPDHQRGVKIMRIA